MAYKALYRTYRPSLFEEVAGQQHIVKTLKNAIETGKIAHAYLFCGPRGTGKTTMAKLFAKALNCEEGLGHQCNVCKNCKAIIDGTHPDVLEIDAASNRGINEIRDLIERVRYAPILGKYKVYIIDEVHMMTPEAFNALLKTLEEPPERVVFILATTEPYKILPTILSRCQRYDFTSVSDEDIRERIKVILKAENIEYNEEAVNLIINLADGGMRDALSILDQLLAYSGNQLNVDDVLNVFSLESKAEKINLLKSIGEKNFAEVLNKTHFYFEKGSDIKRLTDDLLKMLKDLLLFSVSGRSDFFEILEHEDAKELNKHFTTTRINKMIDVLLETSKEYKTVSDIKPLFEICLLRLTGINEDNVKFETKKEETKPQFIGNKEETIIKPVVKEEERLTTQLKDEETNNESPIFDGIKEIDKISILKNSKNDNSFLINQDTMIKVMVSSKKEIKTSYLENWNKLKNLTLHPKYGKVASLLVDAHPLVASDKMLVVEFGMQKTTEKANLIENQKDIQTVIYNLFNKKTFVYGVTRSQSVDLQTIFRNLKQVNKLPKDIDVYLEFTEE